MEDVLRHLRRRDGLSIGVLHKAIFPTGRVNRNWFEALIDCLGRANLVRTEEDSFEKNGKVITFRRAWLDDDGSVSRADTKQLLWLDTS